MHNTSVNTWNEYMVCNFFEISHSFEMLLKFRSEILYISCIFLVYILPYMQHRVCYALCPCDSCTVYRDLRCEILPSEEFPNTECLVVQLF